MDRHVGHVLAASLGLCLVWAPRPFHCRFSFLNYKAIFEFGDFWFSVPILLKFTLYHELIIYMFSNTLSRNPCYWIWLALSLSLCNDVFDSKFVNTVCLWSNPSFQAVLAVVIYTWYFERG